jgi:hypothetical protein
MGNNVKFTKYVELVGIGSAFLALAIENLVPKLRDWHDKYEVLESEGDEDDIDMAAAQARYVELQGIESRGQLTQDQADELNELRQILVESSRPASPGENRAYVPPTSSEMSGGGMPDMDRMRTSGQQEFRL